MSFLGALGGLGQLGQFGINPGTISPFLQKIQDQANNKELQRGQFEGLGQLKDLDLRNQQDFQKNQFQGLKDLQNNQFDRPEQAFKDYGLPSFMAYDKAGSSLPRTMYNLGGSNYSLGGPAGSRQPTQTNPYQQYIGWGKPQGF